MFDVVAVVFHRLAFTGIGTLKSHIRSRLHDIKTILLKSFEEPIFYACETLCFLTAKSSVKTIKVVLKVNFFPSFLELLG
jgi:thermostable 8-oxoguanine DNA glycosylase